jgi:hypothetical protein
MFVCALTSTLVIIGGAHQEKMRGRANATHIYIDKSTRRSLKHAAAVRFYRTVHAELNFNFFSYKFVFLLVMSIKRACNADGVHVWKCTRAPSRKIISAAPAM